MKKLLESIELVELPRLVPIALMITGLAILFYPTTDLMVKNLINPCQTTKK